jgi:hypothetical protein
MLDIKHNGRTVALVAVTAGYLLGITMPALAQDVVKSPEKWRPRDGDYIVPAEHPTDEPRCEVTRDFYFHKKWIAAGEAFRCKIKKSPTLLKTRSTLTSIATKTVLVAIRMTSVGKRRSQRFGGSTRNPSSCT